MSSLSLAEAAAQVGCNRTTLLRSIKSGRLSGTRDETTGAWSVEASELFRVFTPVVASKPPAAVPHDAHADALVALLREQLTEMRGQRDDMRAQRDSWQSIAERLTAALPKPEASEPQPKPEVNAEVKPPVARSRLRRLAGWLNGYAY
jgi:hypothetical protein